MIINREKLHRFLSNSDQYQKDSANLQIFQFIQPMADSVWNFVSADNMIYDYLYWSKPVTNQKFIAFGELFKLNINSSQLPNIISNNFDFQLQEIPDFLCALKFPMEARFATWNDYEQQSWFVPRFTLLSENKKTFLIINFLNSELNDSNYILSLIEEVFIKEIDPSIISKHYLKILENKQNTFEDWSNKINSIKKEINLGVVKKVVLTRKIEFDCTSVVSWQFIAEKLEKENRDTFNFIYKKSGSTFFGASPEKLLTFNKDIIDTEALAGSIKRGDSVEEDELIATYLMNDLKELEEHKSVVDYLLSVISKFSDDIEYEESPKLKKLKHIQHLWTPIKAKLKYQSSIEQVINLMHPTPAVCGEPKDIALKIIRENENFDRGLFSGVLGWFNKSGSGEFIVGIRSAHLKDSILTVFAGCGIVKDSDAKKEFEETDLKFKSILSIFTDEKIS